MTNSTAMVKQSLQQDNEETTPPLPGTSSEPDFMSPLMTRKNPPMPDRPTVVDVVEDAQTQTVATMQGLHQQQRELAQQHPPQVPQPDVPEDPAYDWDTLRLPMATSFPVPCTGRVHRMASELLARLPTLAGRDQKEATSVLNMTADWLGLDDEGKSIVFQRLYLCFSGCLWVADGHRRHLRCRRRRRPSTTWDDSSPPPAVVGFSKVDVRTLRSSNNNSSSRNSVSSHNSVSSEDEKVNS